MVKPAIAPKSTVVAKFIPDPLAFSPAQSGSRLVTPKLCVKNDVGSNSDALTILGSHADTWQQVGPLRPRLTELSVDGGGGIRTHGDASATTVFKTAPLNRSGTPPHAILACQEAAARPDKTGCPLGCGMPAL